MSQQKEKAMELTGQITRVMIAPIGGGEPRELNFEPITTAICDMRESLCFAREQVLKLSCTLKCPLPTRARLYLQQLAGIKKAPRFTYKTKKQYGYAKRNRR